jgi:outer membrane biosynthesis protein TonB
MSVLAAPGPDRFARFLWSSVAVHVGLVVVAIVVAKWPRDPARNPPLTFELVGAPPRGAVGPPTAPPAAEETSAPAVPEPAVAEPPPPPVPAATMPAPSLPTPKPAAQSSTKPASTPTSTAPSTKAPTSPLPAGPLTGQPTGDTLSVGGQGGTPSAMTLWLSRVKFQVERNWSAPVGLPGVKASPEVVFEVARDGRPGRPKLRVKSGSDMLDRLALRAVSAVESFPPVPSSWQGETVVVRYVLQYAH